MADAQLQHHQRDKGVASKLAAALARSTDQYDLNDSAKAALGHIAGYLAHSATKWSKCASCASVLVDHHADTVSVTVEQSVTSTFTAFSELLDRGKLLVPFSTAVEMTPAVSHLETADWRRRYEKRNDELVQPTTGFHRSRSSSR